MDLGRFSLKSWVDAANICGGFKRFPSCVLGGVEQYCFRPLLCLSRKVAGWKEHDVLLDGYGIVFSTSRCIRLLP